MKQAALAEHVSQHAPLFDQDVDAPVLSTVMLDHSGRSFECFVVDPAAGRTIRQSADRGPILRRRGTHPVS